MSIVNTPLLRKALEWAETEAAKSEEECGWYQPAYMVPAMLGDGVPRNFVSSDGETLITKSESINGCGTAFCIAGWVYWQVTGKTKNDSIDDVATLASRELGLVDNQAVWLFSSTNSITQLRSIAEQIADEKL